MKEFTMNDKVKFTGNVDLPALEETVIVHANNQHHQAIIRHEAGHLGSQFSGMNLPANERFAFVKYDHLISLSESGSAAVPEVSTEEVKPNLHVVHDQQKVETDNLRNANLSEILKSLIQLRPEDEHDLISKMIDSASKLEAKKKAAADKKAEEDAANAQLNAKKEIEEANKRAQEEEDKRNHATHDELSSETKKRLAEEAAQREKISNMIDSAESLGIIVITENQVVRKSDGRVLFNMGRLELANFLQNTPDEFINFSALINEAREAGKAPGSESSADDLKKWEEENERKNQEEMKRREDEKAKKAAEPNSPAESAKANAAEPNSNTPALSPEIINEYKQRIVDLKGVGEKTAEKIIAAYSNPVALITAVKNKELVAFTDKVNDALKKLVKTKFFKSFGA